MSGVSSKEFLLPSILRIDHLVLTCEDVTATVEWYRRVLGFEAKEAEGRWSLHFGQQKINLHQKGRELEPHALKPTPGSGDLCFLTDASSEEWLEHLLVEGVVIVEGPIARVGALGPMESVYVRDPDGTLVEISRYDAAVTP